MILFVVRRKKLVFAMLLSVIIPCYNCKGKIEKCLDSIYSQGLPEEEFEVICVDDYSPDLSSVLAIRNYIDSCPQKNLKILESRVNRRQGGARNAGIDMACGKFILFIDQDDYFHSGSLLSVMNILCPFDGDMVMFDHSFEKDGRVKSNQYAHNDSILYRGTTFLVKNEPTWAPWGYAYRREFLNDNSLRFVEHVQFEDVDFIFKCIAKSSKIFFSPLVTIHYSVHKDSQTNIGRDSVQKLDFMFQLSERVGAVASEIDEIDARNVVRRHSLFAYRDATYRLIYLRSLREKYTLIKKFCRGKFTCSDDFYLMFISYFPLLYTLILHFASPFLRWFVLYRKHKSTTSATDND